MNAPARADEHGPNVNGKPGRDGGPGSAAKATRARRALERLRTRLPGWAGIATGLVVAATVTVRLWPLLGRHMLGGLLEYDDGVHYDGAAHLIGGILPYRDFVFVQPPGVLLLLAPFAAFGRIAGDQTAMTAARLAMILVAAGNVFLLMRLTRRRGGRVAAVVAGATYAAWGGAAAAERTVLLEPLVSLGLLGAMTLLDARAVTGRRAFGAAAEHRWRLVAAGAVLGLALAVKTWALADIVVLAGWLGWRSGWRAAAAMAGSACCAAAAICLPFFITAPGAMFHQVIVDQLGRTERLTPDPVVFMHEVAGVGQVYQRAGAAPAAAIAVMALFALTVLVTLVRGPRIWAVLAIVQVALVVPERSYTYHYIDFAAPALAACAGIAAAAALRAAARLGWPEATAAGLAMATALGLLGWQSVTNDVVGSPVQAEFRAFFAAHPCAFSDYPSLLAAADAETRQVRLHCTNLVDYTGAALSIGDGRMLVRLGHGPRGKLYRSPGWQAQVRRVLAASDAAVLSWRPQRWTAAMWLYFHHRFRELSRVGFFTVWVQRG
jgi:alpha-1,2-mannosyltransferase